MHCKSRNFYPILFRMLLATGLVISCASSNSPVTGWDLVEVILREIHPPSFSDRNYDITDFGATGDSRSDCTRAINTAIDVCHTEGGGRVVVPAGVYLTGAIYLKSNVNLHLRENAVLLFRQETAAYLPNVLTRFEGVELMNYSPFIYAYEQENIAITGKGTLDGQAGNTTWWSWSRKTKYGWKEGDPDQVADRDALFRMAEENVPVADRVFGEGHYLRPNFIQFYRCRNILIDSVTIQRSPMWEIHPVLSENITIQNVKIDSHGPNNDGCNPESCRNVLIRNCYFDTGDDCIAIKSGRNADGRRLNVPSENIIIQGCHMKDGHGGVVIGSEISGNCRNVFAEDCVMDSPDLERALRIKTNSLRGGLVENIYMRNVTVGEVSDAIVRIYFHYEQGDVGNHTPVVRNVFVDNVTSRKSRYALLMDGYERSPIENIQINNCRFDGVTEGNLLRYVENLRMENVYINGQKQESPL